MDSKDSQELSTIYMKPTSDYLSLEGSYLNEILLSVTHQEFSESSMLILDSHEQSLKESRIKHKEKYEEDNSLHLLANLQNYEGRKYQEEIFLRSQEKNSIIVLETGSGKTIISILHILRHLKTYGKNKKVFLFSKHLGNVLIDCLYGSSNQLSGTTSKEDQWIFKENAIS